MILNLRQLHFQVMLIHVLLVLSLQQLIILRLHFWSADINIIFIIMDYYYYYYSLPFISLSPIQSFCFAPFLVFALFRLPPLALVTPLLDFDYSSCSSFVTPTGCDTITTASYDNLP